MSSPLLVTVWALIRAASPGPLQARQQRGGPRLLEREGGNTEHDDLKKQQSHTYNRRLAGAVRARVEFATENEKPLLSHPGQLCTSM